MPNNENKFSRLLSLDVFRGIAIAIMILVNSPGNQTAYTWMDHSEWNGCTFADLAFPFFVFIVGVSAVFSLSKQLHDGKKANQLWGKIVKRTIIIFLIGVFLTAIPAHLNSTIRILGVLQHIAICYFFASVLFLTTRIQVQAVIAAGLLVGYWLLMTCVPVPGSGINDLTQAGNLAAYIDRLILTPQHMYTKLYDPEGILTILPSVATVLLGNLTGAWLLTDNSCQKKCWGMLTAGVLSLSLGWAWGFLFPINKALWTSSYVLWTAGLALCVLSLCYWLNDIKNDRMWSKPLEILGVNAIAAYVLHIFFLKMQNMIHIPRMNGTPGNLRFYITEHLFGWAPLQTASMLYAVSYTLFWILILSILYRKKIFIKI